MKSVTTQPVIANASAHADRLIKQNALAMYRAGLAANTITAQRNDLDRWAQFVTEQTATNCDWRDCLACWQPVTHGLVTVFVAWMAGRYATATTNRALATIKEYSRLAASAGHLQPEQYTLIANVKGLHGGNARNHKVRASAKKAQWTAMTADQRGALRTKPDTPQGRRDAVIVEVLLGLGVRVSELQSLTIGDIDLSSQTMRITRHKTNTVQTLRLHNGVLAAITAYITIDRAGAMPTDALLLGSNRWGQLVGAMTIIAIQKRVCALGAAVGIGALSPHDLRHDWATRAAIATPIKAFQDAGGWASPAMPLRYVASAAVANDGVILPD